MFGAIAEWRPVVNGYSGYDAPQHAALRDLLERHDPRALRVLAGSGPIEVVVSRPLDPYGAWARFVAAYPGARPGPAGDLWQSFLLPAGQPEITLADAGTVIPIAAVVVSTNQHDAGAINDGDLESRWNVSSQRGGETVTLDLGSDRQVGAVQLCLGRYPGQYPQGLDVDVSTDGSSWQPAYRGDVLVQTYQAALRFPREVPVTLQLTEGAESAPRLVRFIRLRQTARAPQVGWSIVEARVLR